MKKSLTFDGVSFGFVNNPLLFDDLNLSLEASEGKGKIVSVMGKSGTGKTTLLNLVNGNELPLKGVITTKGNKKMVSYLPQTPVILNHLSIKQNLKLLSNLKYYKEHFDKDKVNKLINKLGFTRLVNSDVKVNELSGGEKQRIGLIRALSINPDFLLLDEPTAGLDTEIKEDFLIELRELTINNGILALFVTHNFSDTLLISDEILYLEKYKESTICLHYPTIDFLSNPPTLSALNSIKYPFNIVLSFNKLLADNIEISNNNVENLKIGIDSDQLMETNSDQFIKLNKITFNDYLDVYQSPAKDTVIVKKNKFDGRDSVNVKIKGLAKLYANGSFERVIDVKNAFIEQSGKNDGK